MLNLIKHHDDKHIAKRWENASLLAQNISEFNKSLHLANTSLEQNCIDVCAHQKEIDVLYHLTKQPTYVAFLDYSTAFPSVHRAKLLASLSECGIVGRMWMHLRARFQSVFIRVLHPGIRESNTVEILRGLPDLPYSVSL